jgi:hypothetical protein
MITENENLGYMVKSIFRPVARNGSVITTPI